MKTLLIMRHAKSSWKDDGRSDHDRTLNNRGAADAPLIGTALKDLDLTPQLIVSSTARRARMTAELVAETCGYEGEIQMDGSLYHAGVDEFIDTLRNLSEEKSIVMVVGHNPGVSELVDYLTDMPEMMTTANVAIVKLPIDEWDALDFDTEGNLQQVLRPRSL